MIYKHGMKQDENSLIPFEGYKAFTFYKWIFTRKGVELTQVDFTHEGIHLKQEVELLVFIFYIWYAIEYLIKLLCTFDHKRVYRSICFEQEAYGHEDDVKWPDQRPEYYWLRFVFKLAEKRR